MYTDLLISFSLMRSSDMDTDVGGLGGCSPEIVSTKAIALELFVEN